MLTTLVTSSAKSPLHIWAETSNLSKHLAKAYHMHMETCTILDWLGHSLTSFAPLIPEKWSPQMELTKLHEHGFVI